MAAAGEEDAEEVGQLSAPAQDLDSAAVGRQGDIPDALADTDAAQAAAIPEQSGRDDGDDQRGDGALGEQGEAAESGTLALQAHEGSSEATAPTVDIPPDQELHSVGGDIAGDADADVNVVAASQDEPEQSCVAQQEGGESQEGQEPAATAAEPVAGVFGAEPGAVELGYAAVEREDATGPGDAAVGAAGHGAEQAGAAQAAAEGRGEAEAEQQQEPEQQAQMWEREQQQEGEPLDAEDEAPELEQPSEGEEQADTNEAAGSGSFGSVLVEPASAAGDEAAAEGGNSYTAADEQEQQQQLSQEGSDGFVEAEEHVAGAQEDPEPPGFVALAAAGPGADEDEAAAGAYGEGEAEGEPQWGQERAEDAEFASEAEAAAAAGQDAPPAASEPCSDGGDEDAYVDGGSDAEGEEQRDGYEQGDPEGAEGDWRQAGQQQEEEEQGEEQEEGEEQEMYAELEPGGEQEEEVEQQDPGYEESFMHALHAQQGGAAAAAAEEEADAEADDHVKGAEADEAAEYEEEQYVAAADPQAAPPSLPRSPSGPTGAVAAMGHLPPIHSPNGPLPDRGYWQQQEDKIRQPYTKDGRAGGSRGAGAGAGGAKQQPGRSSPARGSPSSPGTPSSLPSRTTQRASARQQQHGSHGSPSKRQPRPQQQQRQLPQQQAAAAARPAALQVAPAPPSAAPAPSERSPRLKDVLQGDDPDPHSITQHYLRLLKEGALSRPGTAPAGAVQEPTSPGAASTISAPGMAARGGGSAQGPRQHPHRPTSSASTAASATSGVSPHAADLARLQARSAWEPTPVPLRTHSGGGSTRPQSAYDEQSFHLQRQQQQQQQQVVSPRSPAGGASRSSLPPLSVHTHGPAASAPGSRAGSPPRAFRALRPEVPSRAFTPRATTSAAPYAKMYTPGPGAYSPTVSRRGDAGTLGCGHVSGASPPRAFSFGGATQRPHHVCIHTAVDSPGPAYLPSKDALSTTHSTPNYKFDRSLPGARASLTAGVPTNAPMHNPGAGTYDPAATPHGEPLSPGAAAPAHAFPRGRKLLRPATAGGALPVISKEHMREFHGTCSPGPAAYSPDVSPTRGSPPAYSVASKPASVFERPSGDTTTAFPGPGAYHPGELDRAGHRTLGDAPHAVVGTGPKLYDPVEHLPAAPWLGMAAARRVNLGVHSPGPAVYAPRDPRVGHVASPLLASGPKERFTGRHEPGRLQ